MACYQVHAGGGWGQHEGSEGEAAGSRIHTSLPLKYHWPELSANGSTMFGHGKYSLHFGWLWVQLKCRGFNTVEEWKREAASIRSQN